MKVKIIVINRLIFVIFNILKIIIFKIFLFMVFSICWIVNFFVFWFRINDMILNSLMVVNKLLMMVIFKNNILEIFDC